MAEPTAAKDMGPVLDIGVSEFDLEQIAGEWTPQRCLYLARVDEIDAVCRILNRVNREAAMRDA